MTIVKIGPRAHRCRRNGQHRRGAGNFFSNHPISSAGPSLAAAGWSKFSPASMSAWLPRAEGLRSSRRPPLRTRSRLMQCNTPLLDQLVRAGEQRGGTVRFRAFAVPRLTTSSYVVGARTGRSAGFAHAAGRYRSLRLRWHRRNARRCRLSPDYLDPSASRCDARDDLRCEQR